MSNIVARGVVDYALNERCFHNHRDKPYRFQDLIHLIQGSTQEIPDSVIQQSGLVVALIPNPIIEIDPYEDDALRDDLLEALGDLPEPLTLPTTWERMRRVRIPSERMDLGCNLSTEFQQYMVGITSKQSCNMLREWLPLSRTDAEKNEGLSFPSSCARWSMLAARELDRENIDIAPEAAKMIHDDGLRHIEDAPKILEDIFGLRKVIQFPRILVSWAYHSRNLSPSWSQLFPLSRLFQPQKTPSPRIQILSSSTQHRSLLVQSILRSRSCMMAY